MAEKTNNSTAAKKSAKKRTAKKGKALSLEQKLRMLSKLTLDIAACENKKRELEAKAAVLRLELGAVLSPLLGNITPTANVAPTITSATNVMSIAPTTKQTTPFLATASVADSADGALDPALVLGSVNKVAGGTGTNDKFLVDEYHNEDGSPKSIFNVKK